MAEIILNVKGTEDETLEAELAALLTGELQTKIGAALAEVRDDMRDTLARHVEKDVYKAYQNPIEYERRGVNGGLQGQAMNATVHAGPIGQDGKNYRIYLEFKPDGNHPDAANWKEPPVHGDEFISRIENWNPKYPYPPRHRKLPRRPFWQKYVEELMDDGMADVFLARALRAQGEEVIEDFGVEREAEDGDY